MANEASIFLVRCIVEAGELFGVSRAEQLAALKDPAVINRRWGAVDWEEFLKLFRVSIRTVGKEAELIEAGRRYMRERYKARTAYLYGQFTSWDKILWVVKHFMAGRIIKGYSFDFEKIGPDHFNIEMGIPETFEGSEDFFYFLTGIWTGSSPAANLKHQLISLEIHPHGGSAEVKLGKRALPSRFLENPLTSRIRTWNALRKEKAATRKRKQRLERSVADLRGAFDAVSDIIFVLRGDTIVECNQAARNLLDYPGFTPQRLLESLASPESFEFQLPSSSVVMKEVKPLRMPENDSEVLLVTLAERADVQAQERASKEVARRERERLRDEVDFSIGSRLYAIEAEVERVLSSVAGNEAKEKFEKLLETVQACKTQEQIVTSRESERIKNATMFRESLLTLAADLERTFGFVVEIHSDQFPSFLREGDWGELFLILQEALRNSYRHSGGKKATIEFDSDGFRVLDDGAGLRDSSASKAGVGLRSIRHRADKIGFVASMLPIPENGWLFKRAAGDQDSAG